MSNFNRNDGELFAEGVPLSLIAREVGTPCYIYSKKALENNFKAFSSFKEKTEMPFQINYAVKANSNLAVLNTLAKMGSGFDIVSIGELERVLNAGGDKNKIVFSGVGKSSKELELAIIQQVGCINVESESELLRINEIAERLNVKANIAVRINPDVNPNSHPYISTGLKENKFGVPLKNVISTYQSASQLSHINIQGIAFHIGSQILEINPFLEAIDKTLLIIEELKSLGINIKHLNVGGGLGIPYKNKNELQELEPSVYINAILEKIKNKNLVLHLEPGRAIVGTTGILLTKVEYIKDHFAIVDAAMNDLLRPALYEAWQEIVPIKERKDGEENYYDIVGPVCETADFLGKNRRLNIKEGDLLAVLCAGAYGFSMSSNYNSRPRAAEVMVSEDSFQVVRPRENISDLFSTEKLFNEKNSYFGCADSSEIML